MYVYKVVKEKNSRHDSNNGQLSKSEFVFVSEMGLMLLG